MRCGADVLRNKDKPAMEIAPFTRFIDREIGCNEPLRIGELTFPAFHFPTRGAGHEPRFRARNHMS